MLIKSIRYLNMFANPVLRCKAKSFGTIKKTSAGNPCLEILWKTTRRMYSIIFLITLNYDQKHIDNMCNLNSHNSRNIHMGVHGII